MNQLSGNVGGPVLQAGVVRDVHFHQHAARQIVPQQLGPAPTNFTNRERELAELDQAWPDAEQRCGLVVLSGLGGIGKSALALSWLHRVRDRFADGQLYADLSAEEHGGPVEPASVLGGFLRAFGVSSQELPAGAAQRAVWFRSLVADRAVAILLDNAWTAAQVRALLPAAPRSVVVVTARRMLRALVTDGARFVDVGPLSTADSANLLGKVVGKQRISAEPGPAAELARLCGGLPIALSVTAARLAARRRLELGRTVAELRQEQRRLGLLSRGEQEVSVRSVFDVSYQGLSAATRSAYRALGMHPGREFGLSVAAAAAGLPADELSEAVEALLEAHLLEEVRTDRYRLHDLLRLHAKEKAEAEDSAAERAAAVLRIVEHYIRGTGEAAALCTPHLRGTDYEFVHSAPAIEPFDGLADALAWLEDERANLVGAVRTATEHGWPAAAWQLAYVMWPLFRHGGHHADWQAVDELAVEAARVLGNAEWEARATRRLALLHHRRSSFPEAERLLHRCAELFAELGDDYGTADTADARAVLALAQGDPEGALESANTAAAGFRTLGHPRKAALNLLLAGQARVRSGARAAGLADLRTAVAELGDLSDVDPYNAVRAKIQLGEALVEPGPRLRPDALEEAGRLLDEGLCWMRDSGSTAGQALAHRALATLATARDDRTREREHLAAAVRLFEHQGLAADAEPLRARLTDPNGPA